MINKYNWNVRNFFSNILTKTMKCIDLYMERKFFLKFGFTRNYKITKAWFALTMVRYSDMT